MTTTIMYEFTTLNEYIRIERGSLYGASAIKKRETEIARQHFINHPSIKTKCKIHFNWIMKNKRKDLDNIAFAKKYILDGMVKANVLLNDNTNHVVAFEDTYTMGNQWGVEVRIEEVD